MPEIKKAFDRFNTPGNPYRPKLTIVTSDKHHHTRFFPTDTWHAAQDGNPKPGTVVDRGATAVYGYDFYLQAHDGEYTCVPIPSSLQTYETNASVKRVHGDGNTDALPGCPR